MMLPGDYLLIENPARSRADLACLTPKSRCGLMQSEFTNRLGIFSKSCFDIAISMRLLCR